MNLMRENRWDDIKRAMMTLPVVMSLGVMGCAGDPPPTPAQKKTEPKIEFERATREAVSPKTDVPQEVSPEAEKPTKAKEEQALHFMDYIASHCLVDQLDYTEYAVGWIKWARKSRFKPKTGPTMTTGKQKRAPHGSVTAERRAAKLKEQWKANPSSHVVDCRFQVPIRECEHCTGRGSTNGSFTAYIPEALTTNPEKVRSILLLIPGGNGARTRYFLTPIPNKTIHDSMSGGLEVQRHADEYLEANPDATPPIIVSINGGGWLMANGPIEYQTHDVPKEVARVFLGDDDLSKIAIGADGISSGSRAMLRAYAHKPFAINTVGMTCMHCGGDKGGFQFEEDFLSYDEENKILESWRQMSQNGLLHFHFAIGNQDRYYPCNKAIHTRLTKERIIPDLPPRYENCRKGKTGPRSCDTFWQGFDLHDKQGHHYGLLLDSWVMTLHWHFDALDKSVKAIESGALTKVPSFKR